MRIIIIIIIVIILHRFILRIKIMQVEYKLTKRLVIIIIVMIVNIILIFPLPDYELLGGRHLV